MAGGGPDDGATYSPSVAAVYVFNLIVGGKKGALAEFLNGNAIFRLLVTLSFSFPAGALAMPKAFAQSGYVAGEQSLSPRFISREALPIVVGSPHLLAARLNSCRGVGFYVFSHGDLHGGGDGVGKRLDEFPRSENGKGKIDSAEVKA